LVVAFAGLAPGLGGRWLPHAAALFGWSDDESEGSGAAVAERAEVPDDDDVLTFSTFRRIAKEQEGTVVNIHTERYVRTRGYGMPGGRYHSPLEEFFGDDFLRRFFGMPDQGPMSKITSLGSGVVIDEDGYILTNNHVIEDVDDIIVTLNNGAKYSAEVVGTDPLTDLALIRSKTMKDFAVARFGDSDKLEVGDWVMAIGNPFGYGHTVTVGVVSATGRVIGAGQYDNFIQTDASINPGNSGGPLFNIRGELVGINTAIATRTGQSAGIGFAIPINMAADILDQLKETGRVERGWLGVYIQEVTPELAEAYGLDEPAGTLVSRVEEDSPAEEAGLQHGDIIISLDGKKVANQRMLSRMVAKIRPKSRVELEVIRDGKRKTLDVVIGRRPSEAGDLPRRGDERTARLGVRVQDITPDHVRSLRLPGDEGVLVVDVEPGSVADHAGLERGDVILEVNRRKVEDVRDFLEIVQDLKIGDAVAFYIWREGRHLFLAAKIEEED
jgi:serine protease Do